MRRAARLAALLLACAGLAPAAAAPIAAPIAIVPSGQAAQHDTVRPLGEFAPGLIAEFKPLDQDIMKIPNGVIGRQVMDLSQPLKHPPPDQRVYEEPIGLLLSGHLRVDDYGVQEIMVNAADSNGGACGATIWIDGQMLASDASGARRARFSMNILGRATLPPGFHPVRLWIACRVTNRDSLLVRVLQRSPGEPDFHPPERHQFVHEFR